MTEEKPSQKKVYSLFNKQLLNLTDLPENVVTKKSGSIYKVEIPLNLIDNHEKFFAQRLWRQKLFINTKPNSSQLINNCLRVFLRDYNELSNLQRDLVQIGVKLILPSVDNKKG